MLTGNQKVVSGAGVDAASCARCRNFVTLILLQVIVAATILLGISQRTENSMTSKMTEVKTISSVSVATSIEKEGQHDSDLRSSNEIVRLVVISDTHGHHDMLDGLLPSSSDGGDDNNKNMILIHTGDFANRGNIDDVKNFVKWLKSSPQIRQGQYSEILIIDGNHDRDLRNPNSMNLTDLFNNDNIGATLEQQSPSLQSSPPLSAPTIHFLQDEIFVTKCGLRVFAASWKTCESDSFWNAFPFQNDMSATTATTSKLNESVDVVLAHKNPYIRKKILFSQGLQPQSSYKGWRGSKELSSLVLNNSVPLCLSGHVHWSRGYVNVDKKRDNGSNNRVQHTTNASTNSTFVNSASLWPGKLGVGVSSPVIIDYNLRQRKIVHIHCEPHPS